MTSPWPIPGPTPRDELASWSTARLAEGPLPPTPPMAAPPDPGHTELVDGRGVYLRCSPGPLGATPVWYVHGLAGSSTNWTRLAGILGSAAPGYAVDLPGSGRSDPPPRGRYSLDSDADLVADLITQVSGQPIHLVGNSLGGVVATALAVRHPALIKTLTLISPAVRDLRLGHDRGADPRLAVLLVPGTGPVARRRLAQIGPLARAQGMGALCFGDPSLITDSDYQVAAEDLAWRADLPWGHGATISSLRALMRTYLRPAKWSFAAAAQRITVPTLVVWGTRDRLVDVRLSQATANLFPDSRLLVLPGVGHVAQMEAPEPTARAILALWRDTEGDAGAPLPVGSQAVATSSP